MQTEWLEMQVLQLHNTGQFRVSNICGPVEIMARATAHGKINEPPIAVGSDTSRLEKDWNALAEWNCVDVA